MNKTTIITAVATLIVGFGAGYFAHVSPAAQASGARGNFAGAYGGARGGAAGSGLLNGVIAAKDSGSITLNTRDGSSHVVLLTPDTNISKSVNGTIADIATGSNIIVSGTTNSDGSVSATLIQVRPAMPTATTKAQ